MLQKAFVTARATWIVFQAPSAPQDEGGGF